MLRLFKKISLSLASIAIIFSFSLTPVLANTCTDNAQTPQQAAKCGINAGSNCSSNPHDPNYCPPASQSVSTLISTILNILSSVVGIVAIIMIIVAGLRYVTSGGSDNGVKAAKGTLLYAIIGLVIVAVAQILVHFVLHTVNKAAH